MYNYNNIVNPLQADQIHLVKDAAGNQKGWIVNRITDLWLHIDHIKCVDF